MTRSLLIFLAASIAYAQPNDAQPGRMRPDAPAQHEIARKNIPHLGDSESFMTPRDPEPEPPLDKRITAAVRLSEDTRSDDFPDIATNPEDRSEVWMVWASYDGYRDEVRLAKYDNAKSRWATWTQIPGVSGDVWKPRLAFAEQGRIWVVWSQQADGNFDLYARWYDGSTYGPLQRLTSAAQSDFDHDVYYRDGKIHLVWQAYRGRQSDVFYMVYENGRWGQEILVSDSPRNDWEPAVAADSKGNVTVAWDTYDKGRYDVRMRRIVNGEPGPVVEVAATERLEQRPDLAVDGNDSVWVSYEYGRVNWAKDQGRLDPVGTAPGYPIYDLRGVEVAAYSGERRLGMAAPFAIERGAKVYTPEEGQLHHYGRIHIDDRDRLHLIVRNRQGRRLADYWRFFVATLTADGWTEPAMFPYSKGRASMIAAAAPAADGLWIAWPRDNHPTFSVMVNTPEETIIENVYAARYEPGVASSPAKLSDRRPPGRGQADRASLRKAGCRAHPRLSRARRGPRTAHSARRYPPPYGIVDGFAGIARRIASRLLPLHDRRRRDGLGISVRPSVRRRPHLLVVADGEGCGICTCRRALPRCSDTSARCATPTATATCSTPSAVFRTCRFSRRPTTICSGTTAIGQVIEDDTKMLYEEIRRTGGMAISHTSATNMGTNWGDNDPRVGAGSGDLSGRPLQLRVRGVSVCRQGRQLSVGGVGDAGDDSRGRHGGRGLGQGLPSGRDRQLGPPFDAHVLRAGLR